MTTETTKTKLLVLGSGPGGYSAAFRAADLGIQTLLVERYETLGGVCLNVGCIPSKALLHVSAVVDEAVELEQRGIVRFGKPDIDLDALRNWKDRVVGGLTKGLKQLAKKRGVTVVHGVGSFRSPHELEVATGEGARTIEFDQAIIAAGSHTFELPGIPYEDPRVMSSTGALELENAPESMLVIGGGIIGLEMATVYNSLGTKVTVVELTESLIPGCDPDLVKPLYRRIKKRYEAIHLGARVMRVEPEEEGLRAYIEGPKSRSDELFDRVLVAVGRRPNGLRVGGEAAGVQVNEQGFIPVDGQGRTNVPHIFAIGDIVGNPMLAHKATHEGKIAAEVIAGKSSAFDDRVIPAVAYTDPEIAWVGVSEPEVVSSGRRYHRGLFPWAASGRALSLGRNEGMTKLLFDGDSGRLIGAGMVGPNAGELIAEAALAIEMGSDAADLALTIHPHPTLSETISMAAEVAEGTVTDLYLGPQRKGGAG